MTGVFLAVHAPPIFAGLAAFCIMVYIFADGLDLGVGILFAGVPRAADRGEMIASIEPVLDGNEIWLAAGGALLFSTFPAGYYMLMPAVALPIAAMLAALVLRGAALGMRRRSVRMRPMWDAAFAIGSILAVLCQGLLLGGLIAAVSDAGGPPTESALGLVTPLGMICALGLVGGYGLTGAGWLVWKTDGNTARRARCVARPLLVLTGAMLLLAGLWALWSLPDTTRLTTGLTSVALLVVLTTIGRALATSGGPRLFVRASSLFAFGLVGLAALLWRGLMPLDVQLWDSVADSHALGLVMTGLTIALPLVLAHQIHAFRAFRGRGTVLRRRAGAAHR
ncbi:cytochrome d ubiquinol oxidase subunit II [Ancylobacter sp. A5.8]|uniref:cytochrome d ubiquinol oxidase subunit II n=1 Tax=Ancylobacter gelatini TaxID=2919920 RepID=UPI001F4D5E15|nr:cytochrome d ubiquinol oxidase subunit II [Ancylobacter gelatini]MCJ8142839.1 cytochrome d ubiquinol oxidase subunit II [Ancylobacter gelatini]